MLNFKEITLADKPAIDSFLLNGIDVSCENTFVTLFVWQKAYNNKIAFHNNSLFIKYGFGDKELFRFPIGGNLEEGLKEIIDHCGKYPDFFTPISENFCDLPKWFNEKYSMIPLRDDFDYIYLQSDLSRLAGKKYHSKRNHIRAFSKLHNWHYEDITLKNSEAIRKCARLWYRQNSDRLDKYAHFEAESIETVLSNLDVLNIKGGAIFIDTKAVAFTLGTPINEKVFDIFAEKALPEFATAYTVINNEFAKKLNGYKYINREDDMGLEGLRKAKLSYHPTVILEKYKFTPKENL